MFSTLLKKELHENFRTRRTIITVAVFIVIGLASPLLAKYTPQIFRLIPNIPSEISAAIPEPSLVDAIVQYIKNCTQLGLVLIIVLNMSLVAQEKERGTAASLFTRPVQRSAFLLAKWLAAVISLLGSLLLASLGNLLYTTLLFQAPEMAGYFQLTLLIFVFLCFYLTLAYALGSLARNQATSAGMAIAGIVFILMVGAIPRIGDFMPGKLLAWGQNLVLQTQTSAWPALVVSLGLAILALVVACIVLEKEEF